MLTTYIFKLTNWSPPLYSTAASVAILLMVVTGILVWLQQWVLSGRSYTTVAGKSFRPAVIDLGRWRYFTLGLAVVYLLVVVVLPTLALIVAAFRKFLFIRDVASLFDAKQYTLIHFERLFSNPLALRSIVNTMEVGVITALVGGALAFAIGYTVNRTSLPGRRTIDVVSTLPVAIPGLVIGVAYLWAWIGLPGGLYGTLWILALAFIARFMPDTVKALSTSLMQIHRELEEASWICGKGLVGTIRTIVLPLARPGVIAAMTLLVHPGDPRARLLAVPLHQPDHGDGGAAARLLRGRQSRHHGGVQPGADRAARRPDRHRAHSLARRNRQRDRQGGIEFLNQTQDGRTMA